MKEVYECVDCKSKGDSYKTSSKGACPNCGGYVKMWFEE